MEHVDWEEWFDAFDSNNLALLYQEQKSSGEDRGCNTMPGQLERCGVARSRCGRARSVYGRLVFDI